MLRNESFVADVFATRGAFGFATASLSSDRTPTPSTTSSSSPKTPSSSSSSSSSSSQRRRKPLLFTPKQLAALHRYRLFSVEDVLCCHVRSLRSKRDAGLAAALKKVAATSASKRSSSVSRGGGANGVASGGSDRGEGGNGNGKGSETPSGEGDTNHVDAAAVAAARLDWPPVSARLLKALRRCALHHFTPYVSYRSD
jgi:hypothetical protein